MEAAKTAEGEGWNGRQQNLEQEEAVVVRRLALDREEGGEGGNGRDSNGCLGFMAMEQGGAIGA